MTVEAYASPTCAAVIRDAGGAAVRRERRPSSHDAMFELPPNVEFGLARRLATLDDAARLVHDEYVARGYMAASRSGRRLGLHYALPATKVFVATDHARVIGTVSLIPDSPLGLPMDEIYRDELAGFRTAGRQIAEVSAFAVASHTRRLGAGVAAGLMRVLVVYAAHLTHLDELCVAVNPRHVEFYRRFCHFEPFGDTKPFGKVNGAPAVALRLDLSFVRGVIHRVQSSRFHVHAGRPGWDDVYDFFFGARDYYRTLRRFQEDVADACTGAEIFDRFVRHDDDVWGNAPAAGVAYLTSLYLRDPVTALGRAYARMGNYSQSVVGGLRPILTM